MSRLFGRCAGCHAVTELYYVDSVTARCEHCARSERRRSYDNVGRPTLPHDSYNPRTVYQIDDIVSQM